MRPHKLSKPLGVLLNLCKAWLLDVELGVEFGEGLHDSLQAETVELRSQLEL